MSNPRPEKRRAITEAARRVFGTEGYARAAVDAIAAELAADHFNLLTVVHVNQRTFYGTVPLPENEVTETVTGGVRTFLRLYGPP